MTYWVIHYMSRWGHDQHVWCLTAGTRDRVLATIAAEGHRLIRQETYHEG